MNDDKRSFLFEWSTEKRDGFTSRLQSLEAKRRKILQQLGDVDEEIAMTEASLALIEDLTTEARRALGGDVVVSDWTQANVDRLAGAQVDLPSPTDAVLDLIHAEPGIKRSEIMDRLEDKIATDSDRPRTIISGVVSRGKREGTLWETADGRVYESDHPDAARDRGETILTHRDAEGNIIGER